MRLGSYGKPRDAVEATFGWFDVDLRVNPNLSDLAIIDLFAAMQSPDDGTAAIEAMRGMADALVHPEDVEEFWRIARANRQTMEDVATLAMELIGALAERPTQLPSVSSDGQQPTDTNSTDDSFSPAKLALVKDMPPGLAADVMRLSNSA